MLPSPFHHSIRILPHQQDTGGFFVAVLEKVKPLPGEKVYKPSEQTEQKDESHKTQRIKEVRLGILLTCVRLIQFVENDGHFGFW